MDGWNKRQPRFTTCLLLTICPKCPCTKKYVSLISWPNGWMKSCLCSVNSWLCFGGGRRRRRRRRRRRSGTVIARIWICAAALARHNRIQLVVLLLLLLLLLPVLVCFLATNMWRCFVFDCVYCCSISEIAACCFLCCVVGYPLCSSISEQSRVLYLQISTPLSCLVLK